VLFLLWLLAGHFLYRPVREYATVTIKYYYSLLVLIWIGVLISFIPALLLYGQSFVMSAVTSRVMLSTLALPVIGMIKPGMKDFERAVVWFSLILLVLGILDAMGLPILDRSFFQKEDNPFHDHIDSDSFIYLLPGFHWVA
ncbi:hypothetical protein RCJ22_03525, partial [Vibrio sp. FNV 38]|nr:hypothetical protein [Vibrio sp. FNV 38]